jgi:hypothetical protein
VTIDNTQGRPRAPRSPIRTEDESPAKLDAEYRRKKAEIRQDPGLSWEQKERQIKALGDEHYARIREMEREGAA